MFDQFHRLIASRTEASSPPPLHLPLTFTHLASTAPPGTTNTTAATIFPGFDLYLTPPQTQNHLELQQPISQFLHPLHHHHLHLTTPHRIRDDEDEKVEEDELVCIKPRTRGTEDRPWNDDEIIALFSIKNWFPEVAWEHLSRKLEELGFKRSPQDCREKFEEGSSRFYDGIDYDGHNFGKNNFRILSELEEICQGDHSGNNEDGMDDRLEVEGGETARIQASRENRDCVKVEGLRSKDKTKRNRQRKKFEMFCEEVVEKLMVQQEEMHNKLLEDLARRDQEMVAREEEKKKQEMDKINKELNERATEQAIAGNRQVAMIELLQKFTTSLSDDVILLLAGNPSETGILSSMCGASISDQPAAAASLRETGDGDHKNHGSPTGLENCHDKANNKRWPREEVEALINLRCNMDNHGKPGLRNRPTLWERVSKGMTELGYKRNAKRCKEKWENVNKYFRKTKDVRKKR